MIAIRELSALCLLFDNDYIDTFEAIQNKSIAKSKNKSIQRGNAQGDSVSLPAKSKK